MDIQQLIKFDQNLLLNLNGSDSLFVDGFMWVATSTYIWIPIALVLLYVIFKNNKIQESILIIVMLALVIALADQIASGFCKPFFARFRPTRDPELMYMIDIVNGYRGGSFGFISSHAANTFGITLFLSLLIRNKLLTGVLVLWASLNAFSRIYLGVHYPGDILFGTIVGISVGTIIYYLYYYMKKRFFDNPKYISNQYTTSGYLISDIYMLNNTMFLTIISIIILGMIIANYHNF